MVKTWKDHKKLCFSPNSRSCQLVQYYYFFYRKGKSLCSLTRLPIRDDVCCGDNTEAATTSDWKKLLWKLFRQKLSTANQQNGMAAKKAHSLDEQRIKMSTMCRWAAKRSGTNSDAIRTLLIDTEQLRTLNANAFISLHNALMKTSSVCSIKSNVLSRRWPTNLYTNNTTALLPVVIAEESTKYCRLAI